MKRSSLFRLTPRFDGIKQSIEHSKDLYGGIKEAMHRESDVDYDDELTPEKVWQKEVSRNKLTPSAIHRAVFFRQIAAAISGGLMLGGIFWIANAYSVLSALVGFALLSTGYLGYFAHNYRLYQMREQKMIDPKSYFMLALKHPSLLLPSGLPDQRELKREQNTPAKLDD